jgi:hypothetical protein
MNIASKFFTSVKSRANLIVKKQNHKSIMFLTYNQIDTSKVKISYFQII